MAKQRKTRDRKKQKRLDRRRRVEKKQKRNPAPLAREVTPKLADKIDDSYELIQERKYVEAERLLDCLYKRYSRYPAVVEAQVYLYQATEDHESCCRAASRLAELTPRDPDARLMYAQESMFCGRIGIALRNYRRFLQRWPEHTNAEKARNAIALIEEECESKIQDMGFEGASLDLMVMHEETLECLQSGRFEDTAEKCLELLDRYPRFIPARNNLALAYFQSGNVERALHAARETCRLAPDNRFAEATLGRLSFLSGREDEANAIADRIVVNPPMELDPLAAAIECLSFLGRDEDVVVLSEAAQDRGSVDSRCRAVVSHHLAVAQCRLGNEAAAHTSWKLCLKELPTHAEARENLADLESGGGHAPWPESIAKWIPRAVCERVFGDESERWKADGLNLTNDYPAIAALIPALLDRGDPLGRELAMKMAAADGSPVMLDALKQFALGSRGPDSMRYEALNILAGRGRVDSGPHRFFCHGKWTEIKLFSAEITWEQVKCSTQEEQELFEIGTEAVNKRDFARAEDSFQRILDKDPDNYRATYNLCIVWLERDGKAGKRRAQTRMEEVHEQFPDYLFAPIALAQFAIMDGDMDRARELLAPIYDAKKLHASEASALFTAQIQIAVKQREFGAAEQALALLIDVVGEDDPKITQLRAMIDRASRKRNRLLSLI
jgi:tetratricopeptide (TPR) repeat protein